MQAVSPTQEQILAIQQRQSAYYFSAASDVVFRKHGLLGPENPVVATRETEWSEEFEGRPMLFEGCIASGVAERLGIRAQRRQAQRLSLVDRLGRSLGVLVYSRATVRWIPPRRGVESHPYLFVSENPLWNPHLIEYQALESRDGEPILFAEGAGGAWEVVGVRIRDSIVLGAPVLDVAVQHHAAPPYDVGYFEMVDHSHLVDLEEWLVSQLERLSGSSRARPWPSTYRASLTVRHDYDRPVELDELESLLRFYDERGIRSTWFWRLCHGAGPQAEMVTRAGQEIALHTEARTRGQFEAEVRSFRSMFGTPPAGYSAHGGIPAPGNLGLWHIEWSIAAGMSYGETLGTGNVFPHEAVVIRDGAPSASSLLIPAEHRGLDLSLAEDAHRLPELSIEAAESLARGEHCVIMNHPDVHLKELRELVDGLNLREVWLASLADVCEWYRRGPVRTEPSIASEDKMGC